VFKRLVLVAVSVAGLVLSGCRGDQHTPDAGSPSAPASAEIELEQYEAPWHHYKVRHPAGWRSGGSHQEDYLAISRNGDPRVGEPSIRVFVTDTDPDKGLNLHRPTRDELIGPGNWPHMSTVSAEETQVSTATGKVPGFILHGGGVTDGVRYKAIGLDVYGTGHSIEVVCSSAEDEWTQWAGICEEVVHTFIAGDLTSSRKSVVQSPPAPVKDLAALRDSKRAARADNTFPVPVSGRGQDWIVSLGRVIWVDGSGSSTLSVLSTDSGAEIWKKQFDTSDFSATAVGTDKIAVYHAGAGLELLGPEGQRLFAAPPVGPGHVSDPGPGGRLYVVEDRVGQPSVRYHEFQPGSGGKSEAVKVSTPYETFDPARDAEAILLGCPNLRLIRGGTQAWEHETPICARRTGISNDGQLAFGVLIEAGSAELRVLGENGQPLWGRRLNSARESFVFAPGGKRFWFRQYDGAEQRPYLRLVDAQGTLLEQWLFSSKEDNVLAVNDSGSLAMIRVGDDVLVVDDHGAVQLRIPKARLLKTMLHPTERIVYAINEGAHLGSVYDFGAP